MKTTFDFTIDSDTFLPDVVLVHAQNEDAYNYLADELDMRVLTDGSCPLRKEAVGDFISDAGYAHFAVQYN